MRRYARVLVRDKEDAEDLVHDALVRAYQRRATFRRSGSLSPWLLSILHNAFIDRIRSEGAAQRRVRAANLTAARSSEPEQEAAVRLAQLRAAFYSLPDEQRAALHLVAVEDLTYQEAAVALSVPVGTVMSRVSRARCALREIEDGALARGQRLKVVGGRDDAPA